GRRRRDGHPPCLVLEEAVFLTWRTALLLGVVFVEDDLRLGNVNDHFDGVDVRGGGLSRRQTALAPGGEHAEDGRPAQGGGHNQAAAHDSALRLGQRNPT